MDVVCWNFRFWEECFKQMFNKPSHHVFSWFKRPFYVFFISKTPSASRFKASKQQGFKFHQNVLPKNRSIDGTNGGSTPRSWAQKSSKIRVFLGGSDLRIDPSLGTKGFWRHSSSQLDGCVFYDGWFTPQLAPLKAMDGTGSRQPSKPASWIGAL